MVPGSTSRACLLLDAGVVLVLQDLKPSSPGRGGSQVSGWILGPRLGPQEEAWSEHEPAMSSCLATA